MQRIALARVPVHATSINALLVVFICREHAAWHLLAGIPFLWGKTGPMHIIHVSGERI